jgi:hypothetical protein
MNTRTCDIPAAYRHHRRWLRASRNHESREEHMVADYAGTGMTAAARNPLKTRAKLREGNTSLKVEGESPDWPSDKAAAFSTTKSVGQQHFVDSVWISG